MRRAALVLLLLLIPNPVLADTELTAAVNAAFLARLHDAGLHDIAHQRAVEISTNFSHDGRRDGTAEVLAWNEVGPLRAVDQWLNSPDHAAILVDTKYVHIGCGSHFDGTVYWVACVLTGPAPDPQPTQADSPTKEPLATPANTPALLPNTAINSGG